MRPVCHPPLAELMPPSGGGSNEAQLTPVDVLEPDEPDVSLPGLTTVLNPTPSEGALRAVDGAERMLRPGRFEELGAFTVCLGVAFLVFTLPCLATRDAGLQWAYWVSGSLVLIPLARDFIHARTARVTELDPLLSAISSLPDETPPDGLILLLLPVERISRDVMRQSPSTRKAAREAAERIRQLQGNPQNLPVVSPEGAGTESLPRVSAT